MLACQLRKEWWRCNISAKRMASVHKSLFRQEYQANWSGKATKPPFVKVSRHSSCPKTFVFWASGHEHLKIPVTAFVARDSQEKNFPATGESKVVRCAIQPVSC